MFFPIITLETRISACSITTSRTKNTTVFPNLFGSSFTGLLEESEFLFEDEFELLDEAFFAVTFTVYDLEKELPFAVFTITVTVAVPFAFAITLPLPSTVATEVFDEEYDTSPSAPSGKRVAFTVFELPAVRLTLSLSS